jgi:hypothetical protein
LEDIWKEMAEVRVQWMQQTKTATEYELMKLEDIISTDSIICSRVQMKYIWEFQFQQQLGVWKLLTPESIITKLHEEVKLQTNELSTLPLQRSIRRVLNLDVL